VIEKSPLTKAIEKWTKHGGDLDDILSSNRDRAVKSKTEAEAICAAIDALSADPARVVKVLIGSIRLTDYQQLVFTRALS
jgi:hypothetical protein